MNDASATATLSFRGHELELPVHEGTGVDVGIDISQVRKQTGAICIDPGAVNSALIPESKITELIGEEGILRYRGYPIEALAARCSHLEVCYLLLHGELPSSTQLASFESKVRKAPPLPPIQAFFNMFGPEAHPMDVLSGSISWLASHRPALPPGPASSEEEMEAQMVQVYDLLRNVPTIVGNLRRLKHLDRRDLRMAQLDSTQGYSAAFLKLMLPEREIPDVFVEAMNACLIVHADHEQNCSTATVRSVGSANASLYASIVSGVSALSGPLHGGANEAVLLMLDRIISTGRKLSDVIEDVKSGKEKLMGFGHRVYKNFDPRAEKIKELCPLVLSAAGNDQQLFELAQELEQLALNDEYFIQRRLYPNVDFYSGVIYSAMGIPADMFTTLFAVGRLPGWIAHWLEDRADPTRRIQRPRQVYTGHGSRDFVELADRA